MTRSKGFDGFTLFLFIVGSLSCLPDLAIAQSSQNQPGGASSDLVSLSRDPNQWPMAPRDYANTRFSPLDQIKASNIGQLHVAWTFSLGADRGQEAAPLVIDGTMYVVGPYAGPHPNQVFALDAATGELKWSYSPKPNLSAVGVACCDVVTRGLAYDNGKIFLNTLDNYSVALDAKTGKELWHTQLGDINTGQTVTMAPLVVKGKVLIGNSGGELGVRGWVTAVDENSGNIAWRAYATGPDNEVLIGDNFKPQFDWMKGKDLGVKTWPPDAWKIGGGTMWGWIQYDPELNSIYYGTGNPGPWNHTQRPGDNLWTTALFARDPDSGMAKWAYQMSPHDLFDYDEINESILLDLPINNQTRKTIVHMGRNGYIYVLDRESGELLSADQYDYVNATKGVDMKTGRIIRNQDKIPQLGQAVVDVCPNADGAKDWQPSAYSPRTKLIYVPHQHLCMNWKVSDVGYIAGTPYVGATVDMYAGPGGYRGEFMAWDPVQRKKVWAIQEKFPVWSGALVTGGDVAFYGTMDRLFKAVDAKDGKVLWQFRTPSGMIGQPVSYAVNGVQYVAILSGVGGWPGVTANAAVDPHVRNAALGFAGATQDLPAYTAGGSTLLVFALTPPQQQTQSQPQQQTTGASPPQPANQGQAPANQGQGNAPK
ncbi:MAG TPA: PQQ-dependent dehydrogenase, methanol/ethanol family [Xanthobacteraceae bacterium]|jgi:lanthanide-dependent methanol dehydrogenase|nr:PQQ-dependent dehydrogenase, methanol/ethanol family [Xanthobacteraceae bacterium]